MNIATIDYKSNLFIKNTTQKVVFFVYLLILSQITLVAVQKRQVVDVHPD